MRQIPFYVYDSFTRTPYRGNPAGVFLDAEGLSERQMMAMAGEVSLESAFVSTGPKGFALRYFTGTAEVPLCGHATVAAFSALAREGRAPVGERIPFSCPAGRLSVTLDPDEGGDGRGVSVRLAQAPPSFGPPIRGDALCALTIALGTTPHALHPQLPPQVASTGSAFVFVPVGRRETVDAAPGDMALIEDLSRRHEAEGIYVFAMDRRERANGEPMVYARCFAPTCGLDEDPVTGSASGALGCYLAHHGVLHPGAAAFVAEQGVAIGRDGRVLVEPSFGPDGVTNGVEVAGVATLVARGEITVPPDST